MIALDRMKGALLVLCLILLVVGCAATPKTIGQDLYMAKWTLVGATNSIADAHDSGALKGQNYANAKNGVLQTETVINQGKAALVNGKPASALEYLQLARGLLRQLATYAMGGEK